MSGTACLPVTALHTVQHNGTTLLLSGAGSHMTIHDARNKQSLLFKQSVFPSQNIHGITSLHLGNDVTKNTIQVAIWGGCLVRFCLLSLQTERTYDNQSIIIFESQALVDVEDWILDVCVDVSMSEAILLTAHNNLYKLPMGKTRIGLDQKSHLMCSGPQTLLYSGQVIFARDDHLIIASGTVFGEIVVWTYSKQNLLWKIQTRHTFLGHQGSVFGVCLSNIAYWQGTARRLLASCSDDRTIRVWDVTDCDQNLSVTNVTKMSTRETGFGSHLEKGLHLAMAWGHLSRVWNVCFQQFLSTGEKRDYIGLISRGEDGVCQLWSLNLCELFSGNSGNSDALTRVSYDRHHAGKNVWSFLSVVIDGEYRIFTGGADGQIVVRTPSFTVKDSEEQTSLNFKIMSKLLSENPDSQSSSRPTPLSLKQYLLFDCGDIVATTDSGDILLSNVHAVHQCSIIVPGKNRIATTMSSSTGGNFAFFARADGSLFSYDTINRMTFYYDCSMPASVVWMQVVHTSQILYDGSFTFCLLLTMFKSTTQFLTITHTKTGTSVRQCSLQLSAGTVITTGFYDARRKLLVCGSRNGALIMFQAVSEESVKSSNPYIQWHVHGSDSVTSILEFPGSHEVDNQEILYYVSTGRDGTIACHAIKTTVDALTYSTVHRSTPPLGPYIEGAYWLPSKHGGPALIVYGFKSKDFVVWDETNQVQLMSIECGGAHRTWAFSSPKNKNDTANMFIWTKASTLHTYLDVPRKHCIVQYGGHGREIKALAVSPFSTSPSVGTNKQEWLIATGAEDTDIRLFRYTSQAKAKEGTPELSSISVLRGHTTGIQHVLFSSCGRFLFSSGGGEEFLVWRLENIPLLSVGVVLIAKLGKDMGDLDARIMSFDMLHTSPQRDEKTEFTALLAYSNGKAKLITFTYHASDDKTELSSGTKAYSKDGNPFTVLHEYNASAICLTQAYIMVYQNHMLGLTGATDGALRLLKYSGQGSQAVAHQVHQSNIAAMALLVVNSDVRLVVTGGDDNAMGLTIFRVGEAIENTSMITTMVPDAHAAALTAVAILRPDENTLERRVLIVSAGNDQRVRLWRVGLPPRTWMSPHEDYGENAPQVMNTLELEMLCECWTDVADVSSMEILEGQDEENPEHKGHSTLKMMVVGVGIQILQLRIP